MEQLLRFLKGYLRVRVWGFSPERFMNLCARKGIYLWNVRRNAEDIELFMELKAFFKLRPIAKKTGVRVAVLERIGLPFFMPKIRKRWVFLLGILLAVLFWWGSSFFVWKITLYGNVQVTDDQLMTFLEEQGIRIGTACKKLDIISLEKKIRREYPVVTWTSVKLVGTGLQVWIKENEILPPKTTQTVSEGRDLVSTFDAKVVSMVVRKGVPKTAVGERVAEGQILVEGKVPVYNEDASVREYLRVEADADIWLEHSLLFEATLPEFYEKKEYSGRCRKEYFIRIGENYVKLPWKNGFFQDTEIQKNHTPALFEKLQIPLGAGEIQHWEYTIVRKKYAREEAEALLNKKFDNFLVTLEEKGVQILEKDVRIDKEGDCWLVYGRMKVWEKADCLRDSE